MYGEGGSWFALSLCALSWKIQTAGAITLLQPRGLAWLLPFLPFSSVLPTARVSACPWYSPLLGFQLGDTLPEGTWALVCGQITTSAFLEAEKLGCPAMPELGIGEAAGVACAEYITYVSSGSE